MIRESLEILAITNDTIAMEVPYYSIYNPDSLCEAGALTPPTVTSMLTWLQNMYNTNKVTIHYITISLSGRLPFLLVHKVKRSRYTIDAMEVKHEHFRYVIGQQPKNDTMGSCPQMCGRHKEILHLCAGIPSHHSC